MTKKFVFEYINLLIIFTQNKYIIIYFINLFSYYFFKEKKLYNVGVNKHFFLL